MDDLIPLAQCEPAAVLALNNRNARELSWLDEAGLAHLVHEAFLAVATGPLHGVLIAFDQDAVYDSPNFLWFRDRLQRFVYVDRIVIDESARGRGLARRLYEHLFTAARAAGHERVCCEVNAQPPNPASDAFHAALGFSEIGSATLAGGAKTVRYFVRTL